MPAGRAGVMAKPKVSLGTTINVLASGTNGGSSDPTFRPMNHRLGFSAGGRLFALHGWHSTGVQLLWRDPGGPWSNVTRGDVLTGGILTGQNSGDRPASIAFATDALGVERAWVVMAAHGSISSTPLYCRRLTDLDNPLGPFVDPVVELRAGGSNVGNAKPDIMVERPGGGASDRLCVTSNQQTSASTWNLSYGWITDLTIAPVLTNQGNFELGGNNGNRQGGLIQRAAGLGFISARSSSGAANAKLFTHALASDLTTWVESSASGAAAQNASYPTGVFVAATNEWVTCQALSTTNGTVVVQRWNEAGSSIVTELTTDVGYWEPCLAMKGSRLWLLMRKGAAAFDANDIIVSREYIPGSGWTTEDVVEVSGVGGFSSWPSPYRDVGTELIFLTSAVGSASNQRQVLFVSRGV